MPTVGNGYDGDGAVPCSGESHSDHESMFDRNVSPSCLLRHSSSAVASMKVVEAHDLFESLNSPLVLLASMVECSTVVTGGDEDGDQVLLHFPVSSTQIVVSFNENGDDARLIDDEGHNNHLVIGGLNVATCGGGDGVLL